MSHLSERVTKFAGNVSLKRAAPANVNDEHQAAKRTRGRSGCLNCRRRRKKCDEAKPDCTKCRSRGETCEWDTGVTFRLSGIDAQHPSMPQSKGHKRIGSAEFHIVDVTFDRQATPTIQKGSHGDCEQDADLVDNSRLDNDQDEWLEDGKDYLNGTGLNCTGQPQTNGHHEEPVNGTLCSIPEDSSVNCTTKGALGRGRPKCQAFPYEFANPADCFSNEPNVRGITDALTELDTQMLDDPTSNSKGTASIQSKNVSTPHSRFSATIASSASGHCEAAQVDHSYDSEHFIELDVLDYLVSRPPSDGVISASKISNGASVCITNGEQSQSSPCSNGPVAEESPDAHTGCYPNKTCKYLHTILHQHMLDMARKAVPPNQPRYEIQLADSAPPRNPRLQESSKCRSIHVLNSPRVARPLGCTKLLKRRQLELWRNYLEEIAPWLDMFDHERHFQHHIPAMAKSADYLHYSILALSSRQMERKDPTIGVSESLGLYQDAVKLIIREVHNLDTAVVASRILICVLEMMSSPPEAWSRHLEGCAMLLEVAGFNGLVGGVKQAIFWCFARMNVWGGLFGDSMLKDPSCRYFTSGPMSSAISRFRMRCEDDKYANYAVFLCTSVMNVISSCKTTVTNNEACPTSSYTARWGALFDLLEDWYNSRPESMQPLMSYPSILDDYRHPFPMVLYGSCPAVNGNQIYHAAAILMLQDKPIETKLRKSHKSILWHARQICGIAAENHHHAPWINALQPLWIAGKVMSHPTERQAILDILARIERETAWATAWRASDLQSYWGGNEV